MSSNGILPILHAVPRNVQPMDDSGDRLPLAQLAIPEQKTLFSSSYMDSSTGSLSLEETLELINEREHERFYAGSSCESLAEDAVSSSESCYASAQDIPLASSATNDFILAEENFESSQNFDAVYFSAEYSYDIYKYLLERERILRPRPHYIKKQPEVTETMRFILVDWMNEVCTEYKMNVSERFQRIFEFLFKSILI